MIFPVQQLLAAVKQHKKDPRAKKIPLPQPLQVKNSLTSIFTHQPEGREEQHQGVPQEQPEYHTA